MEINTAIIANLYWREKQYNKDCTNNYGADSNSYSVCGSPNSIYQVYYMLKQTNKLFYLELSYNGCEVPRDGSDHLFAWFNGDLNG